MLGLANLQGVVLCIEPDGQVSFESSIGGLCSEALQEASQVHDSAFQGKEVLQASHCRSCIDVPLSLISDKHQTQTLQDFQGSVDIPMLAEAPTINVGYLATATQQQLPQPPPLRPAIHRFLSTIILLI